MKKLLLIAILMLALVFTAVACNDDPVTEETTLGDTTVETPTEAPTDEPEDPTEEVTTADPSEDPTEEVTTEEVTTEEVTTEEVTTEEVTTPDPADPVLLLDPEALNTLAGAGTPNVSQLGSTEVITEDDKTFVRWTAAGGDPYVAILPLGSSAALPQYMAISYRTNSAVEGQFFMGSGAGWSGQGDSFMVTWTEGDWSFVIVDLTQTGVTSITDGVLTYARMDFFAGDSPEGDYFDVQYVGFFNTAEYAIAYNFVINPPYAQPGEAGMKNASFDTFYVNNQMYFPEDGGADAKLDAIDNTLVFASASELESIILRGWIGFDQAIDSFGYYVDNYEFVFDASFAKATEQGVIDAGGEFASRFEIFVPLDTLKGDDHFVGFVVKLADGTIVQLREDITIDLPELPKDITDTFTSDVASNEDGIDLQQSDLANFFTVQYGASEPHSVTGGVYTYGGINEMYTDVNGKYAYSVNMLEAATTAMMFVRGTHVVHSVDVPAPADGLYPINNYYETDGNGHMGGAGVYAAIYGGNLNIYVKVYSEEKLTHVDLKTYAIPTDATELTIADDGETLYFIAGGKLLATVALSGATSYEKLDMVSPEIAFAQTAVVTLADGTTETIENTLVAATCASQIGIALRPATMKFDSVKVQAFSAIEIPEFETSEPVEPDEPTVENVVIDLSTVEGYKASNNFGYDCPIIQIGYGNVFLLGDIDLSKYSQIIIKYSYDGDTVVDNPVEQNWTDCGHAPIIGFTSIDKCFGYANVTNQDAIDAGVYTEIPYTAGSWAAATRTATIDISNVDYNGPCYLSAYNPWNREIAVASIELVPVAETEPETPDEPTVEYYEDLEVPQSDWVISGHMTTILSPENKDAYPNHYPMVAAGGIESGALLYQGSIYLGNLDLSKYSKVVVMWGHDNSAATIDKYNANANNRFALVTANKGTGTMSPAEDTIIAYTTYELKGWGVTALEIDLSEIDYSGDVYLTNDSLEGCFALVYSVEFIGAEIPAAPVEPEA